MFFGEHEIIRSVLTACNTDISRNGPYIGGHLAFYFKLNFKQVYNVL